MRDKEDGYRSTERHKQRIGQLFINFYIVNKSNIYYNE